MKWLKKLWEYMCSDKSNLAYEIFNILSGLRQKSGSGSRYTVSLMHCSQRQVHHMVLTLRDLFQDMAGPRIVVNYVQTWYLNPPKDVRESSVPITVIKITANSIPIVMVTASYELNHSNRWKPLRCRVYHKRIFKLMDKHYDYFSQRESV